MKSRALHILILMMPACAPPVVPSLSLVDGPEVLALRGEPAEVMPGAQLHFDALVASPDGEIVPASLDWSFCLTPKPLADNDVVAPDCLSSGAVEIIASAVPFADAIVPRDACQRFGPELPPPVAGQPDPRPVAADATGGWYQPYRADLGSSLTIGLERIRCNLPGASTDVATAFKMEYSPNQNPQPNPLTIDGAPADGATLAPGATVTLTVDWPDDAAESYPVFDVATQTLVPHREALRTSWYSTAGSFADERTGRTGDDPALWTSNVFTAPTQAGAVHLWAVTRDDRGGVGWTHALLNIE
jgi:hypothetical protein